jgi:hypothetical protein
VHPGKITAKRTPRIRAKMWGLLNAEMWEWQCREPESAGYRYLIPWWVQGWNPMPEIPHLP